MNNSPSRLTLFVRKCGKFTKQILARISKMFDKVIYTPRLALLVSGLLSLIICISVNYEELSFQFFSRNAATLNLNNIPVTALADEENFEISGLPTTADITVVGNAADIQLVRTQNSASISADMRNMTEGSNTVTLKAGGLPTGVDVTVTPSTADVTLTRKIKKTFFISPDLIVGNGQSIAAFNKPKLSVRSVSIKATQDKLNSIRTIRAIIDASGHDKDFTVEAPLVAYDSSGKQVQVSIEPSTVTAEVTMVNSSGQDDGSSTETGNADAADTQAGS